VIYVFEDCSLDPDRRELRRAANFVAVEPQVFDVLVHLIRHRDRVVSRDDLLAAVWGGRIVSESTLSSRINSARSAIGDSGDQQRFIRTIARKGFRFVGEVREKQPSCEAGADMANAPPDDTKAPIWPKWLSRRDRRNRPVWTRFTGLLKRHAAPPASPERRQLTIMVCSMAGSTALSMRLDPEDLRKVIAVYHECLRQVAERHGGFVARYMADGALVYFGYPQAHEDDAERAVRAGLAATKAVAELEIERFPERLQARISIATGLVVVGDVVSTGALTEHAVVGEAPILAGNLLRHADPGAVVISAATRRLLGRLFDYRELGAAEVKGSAEPVDAWQVLGESAVASRFEALRWHHSHLIGREEELDLLTRRWRQAKDGEGRVVLVTGEPGIGKSRLARGLQERLDGETYTPLVYHCSPYHQNSALFPIIAHLLRAAGVDQGEDASNSEDKLATMLARAGADVAQDLPLFAMLLSIPCERYSVPSLAPQQLKERTRGALFDHLKRLAQHRPVLVIFEDIHWIDPSSLELLSRVVDEAARLRIMLLATARPEFTPPWPSHRHTSSIALTRLGRAEIEMLILGVTKGRRLPDEVIDQIVSRTDGVPLFIEELTKTVLESGMLRDAGDRHELPGPLPPFGIPSTIHASLLERLDRLPSVKDLAQIAAAIGREFPYRLLAAVSALPESSLRAALDQLVAAELVYPRGIPPDATFHFKHTLVRDAAYASLLRERRQLLHEKIVERLHDLQPNISASEPETLAHHYEAAGSPAKAAHFRLIAARRAIERYANREAKAHVEAALRLQAAGDSASDDPAHRPLRRDSHVLLGDLHSMAGELDSANDAYAKALSMSRDDRDTTFIQNKLHRFREAKRSGKRIAFYEHGTGRPTIVFVNPINYGLQIFHPIVERLCQQFRVITVDCRGSGRSDPLVRPYTINDHAEDLRAVVEASWSHPVIGVGVSRGSSYWVRLYSHCPHLIAKLMLVGMPPGGTSGEGRRFFSSSFLERVGQLRQDGDRKGLLELLFSHVFSEQNTEQLKQNFMDAAMRLPPETVLSFFDPDPSLDVSALLPTITVPTLVVQGAEDRQIHPDAAATIAGRVPGARMHLFPGKGHLPMFSATVEFCDLLTSFARE